MSDAYMFSLMEACQNHDAERLKLLLSPPHEPTEDDLECALTSTARNWDATILSILLDHKAPLRPVNLVYLDHDTPLDIFQVLLDHGWDINSLDLRDVPFLCHVTRSFETTKWFLDHGAKASIYGRDLKSPLQYSAFFPNKETIDILIENGASLKESNALQSAARAQGDDTEMLAYLIGLGADVTALENQWNLDFKNKRNRHYPDSLSVLLTPLHWAVKLGKVKRAKFLLEQGADPDKDSYPIYKGDPKAGLGGPNPFIWSPRYHVVLHKKSQFYEMFGVKPE